jgi:hypothetical protein
VAWMQISYASSAFESLLANTIAVWSNGKLGGLISPGYKFESCSRNNDDLTQLAEYYSDTIAVESSNLSVITKQSRSSMGHLYPAFNRRVASLPAGKGRFESHRDYIGVNSLLVKRHLSGVWLNAIPLLRFNSMAEDHRYKVVVGSSNLPAATKLVHSSIGLEYPAFTRRVQGSNPCGPTMET